MISTRKQTLLFNPILYSSHLYRFFSHPLIEFQFVYTSSNTQPFEKKIQPFDSIFYFSKYLEHVPNSDKLLSQKAKNPSYFYKYSN